MEIKATAYSACSLSPTGEVKSAHVRASSNDMLRAASSDRVGLAQRRDLLGVEPEFLEHRVGVLADAGRRGDELARRARHCEGLPDQRELAVLHRLRHRDVLDLGIGKHVVDRVDRPRRDARLVEALDPVGAGARYGAPADLGVERVAVLRAARAVSVLRMRDQLGRLERITEALPDLLAGRGYVDVAVGGLEHAG